MLFIVVLLSASTVEGWLKECMSAAVRLHSLTLLPLTDNHPPSEQALSRHVLCTKLLVLFIQDTSLSRTLTILHSQSCSGPENGCPASTPNLWDYRDIGTPRYPCRTFRISDPTTTHCPTVQNHPFSPPSDVTKLAKGDMPLVGWTAHLRKDSLLMPTSNRITLPYNPNSIRH